MISPTVSGFDRSLIHVLHLCTREGKQLLPPAVSFVFVFSGKRLQKRYPRIGITCTCDGVLPYDEVCLPQSSCWSMVWRNPPKSSHYEYNQACNADETKKGIGTYGTSTESWFSFNNFWELRRVDFHRSNQISFKEIMYGFTLSSTTRRFHNIISNKYLDAFFFSLF